MSNENGSGRQVALVTGGMRGIGFGICQSLAGMGFDIVTCGRRSSDEVSGVKLELEAHGHEVVYLQADLREDKTLLHLAGTIRDQFGRLDVLINNAGIAPPDRRDVLDATLPGFQEVMSVNCTAPHFLIQHAAPLMIEQRRRSPECTCCIVNITSVSAAVASVDRAEYCISKAALSMASMIWAVRLGEYGIPVYEIRPGITATDMTAGVRSKYDERIAQGLLVQPRWGMPEDVGRAVAALVRGDFSYSSGQIINVDGGLTLKIL
ncbi:MAG: 3-ketoacyl-ACP reductase [Chitinivibrionales bacterium]|nr:3-ketoacyl-ACP reductase [Chitinivibrionales bacterium]